MDTFLIQFSQTKLNLVLAFFGSSKTEGVIIIKELDVTLLPIFVFVFLYNFC